MAELGAAMRFECHATATFCPAPALWHDRVDRLPATRYFYIVARVPYLIRPSGLTIRPRVGRRHMHCVAAAGVYATSTQPSLGCSGDRDDLGRWRCIVRGHCSSRYPRSARHGTTLLEAALCTALVAIGVAAAMEFMASGTRVNAETARYSTAMSLATAAHEWAANQTFTQLQALEQTPRTCGPVINGQGTTMSGYSAWSQVINATTVNEDNLQQKVTAGSTDSLRVGVTVCFNNKPIYTQEWTHFREIPTP